MNAVHPPFPRKMPIGIQSFEYLRHNDYVYVDKTAFVYRLATMGKPYFLSRPRRFGKSLLLSTMEAYFLGKRGKKPSPVSPDSTTVIASAKTTYRECSIRSAS